MYELSCGLMRPNEEIVCQSRPPNVAYPPRPVPGSAADLDIVMDNCDFSENKVRIAPTP